MEEPILELKDITVLSRRKTILKNINLQIPKGALVALLGESGSGKSTLLKVIAGWQKPSVGSVLMRINGSMADITKMHMNERDIHLMPANYELFLNMDARKNIAYGLKDKNLKVGDVNDEVNKLIAALELNGFEYRPIQNLSSGQQQRIAFARTIIGKPAILLLDEPFSALNERLCIVMQNIIDTYRKLGMTVIYTTHDVKIANAYATVRIKMAGGEIIS